VPMLMVLCGWLMVAELALCLVTIDMLVLSRSSYLFFGHNCMGKFSI
jgi:hypothetical protein